MKAAVSYEMLQELILESNLNEHDMIILHPSDYDNVATEYVVENNLSMFRPVEILGISIVEDTSGEVRKNQVYVMPLAAS